MLKHLLINKINLHIVILYILYNIGDVELKKEFVINYSLNILLYDGYIYIYINK
jgi:hypothetical protein